MGHRALGPCQLGLHQMAAPEFECLAYTHTHRQSLPATLAWLVLLVKEIVIAPGIWYSDVIRMPVCNMPRNPLG